jgi:uncharacterized protein YyaL (SSP411 family)
VLTAWNGLMIAAFARAARVIPAFLEGAVATTETTETTEHTGEQRSSVDSVSSVVGDRDATGGAFLHAAQRAAGFIRDRLWQPGSGTLLRRFRDGHAEIDGYAEDYAYLIFGLLELFQADGDPAWLEWAVTLQRRQDALFWDDQDSGWFSTTGCDPSVLLRMKEDYDGAEPTPSSVSVMNLLRLSHLVEDRDWTARIDRTLRLFGPRLEQLGRAVPMMGAALSTSLAGLQQIIIVGGEGERAGLMRVVARKYLPFALTIPLAEHVRDRVAAVMPLVSAMRPPEGGAAAYVCRNFACQAPVTDPAALEGILV